MKRDRNSPTSSDQYKEEIADAIYNMYENTKQQIQKFPRCFSIDSSSNRGGSSNCSSGSGSSSNLDPERRNKGAGKSLSGYGAKSESYLTKRGWTWDSAQDVVGNPYTTREAVNKATGNSATVFYNKAGDYVVRDNITGELVQTSKFGDVNWIPDSSIINPYKP